MKTEKKKELTHLDRDGEVMMVDVSAKPVVGREAVAEGFVSMAPGTLELIRGNGIAKGNVITVARIAGIQAAKNTSQLIPLCHPLALRHIRVDLRLQDDGIAIEAGVKTSERTGVEMEALTAVSVAALTVYDMCKGADQSMRIGDISLREKTKTPPGE